VASLPSPDRARAARAYGRAVAAAAPVGGGGGGSGGGGGDGHDVEAASTSGRPRDPWSRFAGSGGGGSSPPARGGTGGAGASNPAQPRGPGGPSSWVPAGGPNDDADLTWGQELRGQGEASKHGAGEMGGACPSVVAPQFRDGGVRPPPSRAGARLPPAPTDNSGGIAGGGSCASARWVPTEESLEGSIVDPTLPSSRCSGKGRLHSGCGETLVTTAHCGGPDAVPANVVPDVSPGVLLASLAQRAGGAPWGASTGATRTTAAATAARGWGTAPTVVADEYAFGDEAWGRGGTNPTLVASVPPLPPAPQRSHCSQASPPAGHLLVPMPRPPKDTLLLLPSRPAPSHGGDSQTQRCCRRQTTAALAAALPLTSTTPAAHHTSPPELPPGPAPTVSLLRPASQKRPTPPPLANPLPVLAPAVRKKRRVRTSRSSDC